MATGRFQPLAMNHGRKKKKAAAREMLPKWLGEGCKSIVPLTCEWSGRGKWGAKWGWKKKRKKKKAREDMINTTDPLLSHAHKQQRCFYPEWVKKLALLSLFNMKRASHIPLWLCVVLGKFTWQKILNKLEFKSVFYSRNTKEHLAREWQICVFILRLKFPHC